MSLQTDLNMNEEKINQSLITLFVNWNKKFIFLCKIFDNIKSSRLKNNSTKELLSQIAFYLKKFKRCAYLICLNLIFYSV